MQRFYGSVDWFNIPYKVLNAYAVMLPVIRSGEIQETIQSFACGAGNLEKKDQQKLFRQLEKQSEVVKDPYEIKKPKPINYGALSMIIPVVDMRTKKNGTGQRTSTEGSNSNKVE